MEEEARPFIPSKWMLSKVVSGSVWLRPNPWLVMAKPWICPATGERPWGWPSGGQGPAASLSRKEALPPGLCENASPVWHRSGGLGEEFVHGGLTQPEVCVLERPEQEWRSGPHSFPLSALPQHPIWSLQ